MDRPVEQFVKIGATSVAPCSDLSLQYVVNTINAISSTTTNLSALVPSALCLSVSNTSHLHLCSSMRHHLYQCLKAPTRERYTVPTATNSQVRFILWYEPCRMFTGAATESSRSLVAHYGALSINNLHFSTSARALAICSHLNWTHCNCSMMKASHSKNRPTLVNLPVYLTMFYHRYKHTYHTTVILW